MKKVRGLLVLLFCLTVLLAVPMTASAAQNGWVEKYDKWYYYQNGEMLTDTVAYIKGAYYGFDDEGRMYDDEEFYVYDEWDGGYYYRAQEGGKLLVNTWYETRYWSDDREVKDWYYYGADGKAPSGRYTVNNTVYYFSGDGRMLENEAAYIDGEIYAIYGTNQAVKMQNNAWTYINGHYYYIQDWELCSYGIYYINGAYYAFDSWNRMYEDTETLFYDESGEIHAYRAKKGGKLYTNAWYQDDDGEWAYYDAVGACRDGAQKIGGKWYFFYNSRMTTNAVQKILDNGKCYYYGDDGVLVTKPGWYVAVDIYRENDGFLNQGYIDNGYVYARNTAGELATGWLSLGGKWYYCDPVMAHDTQITVDGKLYAVNKSGVCTAMAKNGLHEGQYFENGKAVKNAWRQVKGAWYYFGDDGYIYKGRELINGKPYVFNDGGQMLSGGWVMLGGDYYYAQSDGVLYIGLQKINGNWYFFDDYGAMLENTVIEHDGTYYKAAASGALTTLRNDGWYSVGGEWYYMRGGELLQDGVYSINGAQYGFYSGGAMACETIYGEHYYSSSGKRQIGWINDVSGWRYDDGNGLYFSGRYTIGGSVYYFEHCDMLVGTFIYDDTTIVTTDKSGRVQSELPLSDGWTYANGNVYYHKNGDPYTGWVGDYYVSDGYMCLDCAHEVGDTGVCYFFDLTGKYRKNGWYRTSYGDAYYYARANGKLYRNEWLQYKGQWYYFDEFCRMVTGVVAVDGEPNLFNEDGVWLGKISLNDGWKKINGEWYYYHAGDRVQGEMYIDGAWYVFSYDDYRMVTNETVVSHYYGADGKRVEATGWVKINGQWAYFYEDHTMADGWATINGKRYYFAYGVNDFPGMVTGYHVDHDSDKLCWFDSNGVYGGTYGVDNGWYKAGGEWYYFKNGQLAWGVIMVDGDEYYFVHGQMVINDWLYVTGGDYYYGVDGKRVTAQGWYKVNGKWVYVGMDGRLVNGMQKINGKVYYFIGNILVD